MNVGLITPIEDDGTSLYRAHGPFAMLSRLAGVDIVSSSRWGWPQIMACNVVFLQRPYEAGHTAIARMCRSLNVPLWVDYDDLYSDFPNWVQPQRAFYGSAEVQRHMAECLELANVVTVSTEALKCISPKAELLPNALPSYFWPLSPARQRANVITWRGSSGHAGDLEWAMGPMREIATERPHHAWHFFGMPSFKCYDFGIVHQYQDAFGYMQEFAALSPKIHVVPLVDCQFNRCKSNNAWLEATAVGAVVVAPAWPEWIRPGVINYADLAGFYSAVTDALDMPDADREALVNQSREYIQRNLTLAKVNEQRVEILRRFA